MLLDPNFTVDLNSRSGIRDHIVKTIVSDLRILGAQVKNDFCLYQCFWTVFTASRTVGSLLQFVVADSTQLLKVLRHAQTLDSLTTSIAVHLKDCVAEKHCLSLILMEIFKNPVQNCKKYTLPVRAVHNSKNHENYQYRVKSLTCTFPTKQNVVRHWFVFHQMVSSFWCKTTTSRIGAAIRNVLF